MVPAGRHLPISFHARTDPGMRRRVNEDAFAVDADHAFCIVCDGMGGHASGEVASTMAVDLVGERLRKAVPPVAARVGADLGPTLATLPRALLEAVRDANGAIHERGARDPRIESGRHMGTTLLVLCFVGRRALLLHIGDSRIYRIRGGAIEALTEDHSVMTEQAQEGEQPARKRKFVTRALGTRTKVVPELREVEVQPGDLFVLCSDGLTDYVRDDELLRLLTWLDPEDLADMPKQLVALANKRGGRDNITVVIAAAEVADAHAEAALAAGEVGTDTTPSMDATDLEIGEETHPALGTGGLPIDLSELYPGAAPLPATSSSDDEPGSAAWSAFPEVPLADPPLGSLALATEPLATRGATPPSLEPVPSDFAPPPLGFVEHRELDAELLRAAPPPPLDPPGS